MKTPQLAVWIPLWWPGTIMLLEIVLPRWSWQCVLLHTVHHYRALLTTEKSVLLIFSHLTADEKDLDVNLCLVFSLMHTARHVVELVILKNCSLLLWAFSWCNPRNRDVVSSRAGEHVISCPCYNIKNRFPGLYFDKSVRQSRVPNIF